MSLSGNWDNTDNQSAMGQSATGDDLFSNLSPKYTVMDAVKAGRIGDVRQFYGRGLNINIDDGELIASAAELGHLDLLTVMCEEMGGVLKSSKCDYPFFLHGLREDVRDYVRSRLDTEARTPVSYRPKPVPNKLSILSIRSSKIQ